MLATPSPSLATTNPERTGVDASAASLQPPAGRGRVRGGEVPRHRLHALRLLWLRRVTYPTLHARLG